MTVTATFTDLGEDRTQVDIEQTNVPAPMLAPRGAGRLPHLARPIRRPPGPADPSGAVMATDDLMPIDHRRAARVRRRARRPVRGRLERAVAVRGLAGAGGRRAHDDALPLLRPAVPRRDGPVPRATSRGWPTGSPAGTPRRRSARCSRAGGPTRTHPWKPPGGGLAGRAHARRRPRPGHHRPARASSTRSASRPCASSSSNATTPLSLKHFGLDLTGIRLEADDLDWAFGDGEPLRGAAHHLLHGAHGPPAAGRAALRSVVRTVRRRLRGWSRRLAPIPGSGAGRVGPDVPSSASSPVRHGVVTRDGQLRREGTAA